MTDVAGEHKRGRAALGQCTGAAGRTGERGQSRIVRSERGDSSQADWASQRQVLAAADGGDRSGSVEDNRVGKCDATADTRLQSAAHKRQVSAAQGTVGGAQSQ